MSEVTPKSWQSLRRRLRGDLYTDILHRVAYSIDASIYRIVPQAVVAPRCPEDIQRVLQFALKRGLAVAPRGAGSGVAGESLCDGIVLDMSRYLQRVVTIDPGAQTVTCEAGVVLDQLNAQLAPHGQKIGPDPSSANRATVGGCVANNATGAHSLQYGHMSAYVESLDVVLADGSLGHCQNHMGLHDDQETHIRALAGQCLDTLSRGQEILRAAQPRTTRNRSGYAVADVVEDGCLDMARLLVGSEGTLGIFTQIKLRTVPIPPAQGLLQLAFDSLEAMGAAVPIIVDQGATACELMDQRLLNLARETLPQYQDIFPENAVALLLVEQVGPDEAAVMEALQHTQAAVGKAASKVQIVTDPEAQQRLWKSRKDAVPLLYRERGRRHPVPFIEDVSVPNTELETYIQGLEGIAQKHAVRFAYYGHAGDGELHVRPYLDLHTTDDVERMTTLAEEVFSLAWSLGGSISGEHADGLIRTGFIRRQYGEEYYAILRQIKETFDPQGVLNPGKIINDDPTVMINHLRRAPALQTERLDSSLRFESEELTEELLQCNSCGLCRTQTLTLRMCPVFRALGDELGTSRAKVNILDYWATGQLETQDFYTAEFREFLDLCVHCKACQRQCPSGVDVSKLVTAARARFAKKKGLRPVERLLSGNRLLSILGTAFAPFSNLALKCPPLGWMLEKVGGLDRKRRLPGFAGHGFQGVARRVLAETEPMTSPIDRVVYFVDTYAQYHDADLGFAVLDVLTLNQIAVELPKQRPVPLPALCYGDTKRAQRDFQSIVRCLKPWARQGYTILCSEPSAALALCRDLRHFVDTPDAALIAERTLSLMDYLLHLHQQGLLMPPQETLTGPFAYHHPCHAAALAGEPATVTLLQQWAQVEIHDLQAGCCGLAGTYGMQKRHADLSRRMGQNLRTALQTLPAIPVLTECASCKMQIEFLGKKEVIHPIKLIAKTYSPLLNPEDSQSGASSD